MRKSADRNLPDWDALYEVAQARAGYFTTEQAAGAGYSSPLLHKYLASGKIARVRRGIYRLVHFPASEYEELNVYWLWSGQVGTFSHETALALHELSDVMPSKVHLTLPESWRGRRLRVPGGLVLHFSDLGGASSTRFARVPVTTPRRTIADCIGARTAPDLVLQAIRQARMRGLITGLDEKDLLRDLDRSASRGE